MSEAMRLRKVRWDGKRVTIEYTRGAGTEEHPADEFAFSCGDEPSRAFKDALQALGKDLNVICEFNPPARITMRSVSLTWKNDILGAVLSGLKHLTTANVPLVLNTPHLPSEKYGPNAGGPLMPDGMRERLRILLDEASRYVLGGAREQARLDLPESTPPADTPPSGPRRVH